jgi:putative addiction module component (TIGR02574 family)
MEGLDARRLDGADKMPPMNARTDQLLDEALSLEVDERSVLAFALLSSLDGEEEAAAAKAWQAEILRRKEELHSGATIAVPWAEARARLAAL